MAFMLYSAGSGTKECQQLIKDIGYHQLLSQLNERSSIMKWVEYLRSHPDCKSKLFIDSGAFSAHTLGKEVDVDDYIHFMNDIDDVVYIFAQVDKIPGKFGQPKTPEELADAPRESWENYLYMVDKVKSRDKLLPIFHQGEDFKWLHNMLNYTHPDGKHIWYIGISPANDVSVAEKKKWLEVVYRIIAESPNPNVKTHAFGMTSLRVLEQFKFTSADSTSWIQTATKGAILIDGRGVIVSEQCMHNPKNVFNQSPGIVEDVRKTVASLGFDLDELSTDYRKRLLFNLTSLKHWADNYDYCGTDTFKQTLF